MPLKIWDGSAFKEVSLLKIWDGSSFANVLNAYTWSGSAWTKFFPSVKITDQSAVNNSRAGIGGSAAATYRLGNDGAARASTGASLVSIAGEWLVGSGTTSDYEAQATVLSGSGGSFSGPGAGWNNLGTTRDWSLTVTNNYGERYVLIEIRPVGSTTTTISATIYFEVDSAP